MTNRIFIAINLPPEIKKELEGHQKQKAQELGCFWKSKEQSLPVKWTKPENIHLTLLFLGNIYEKDLRSVFELVKEVSRRHKPFEIDLGQVIYAPPRARPPRMIWVLVRESGNLLRLKKDLDSGIKNTLPYIFTKEDREFLPHLTLARFKPAFYKEPGIKKIEETNKDTGQNLNFKPGSVEVMESILKPRGPEYRILKSFPLGV